MKFTVADLLDQLSTNDSVETAVIAKILKLTNKSDKQSLDIAIEALSKIGVLTRGEGDVVARTRNDEFIDARLRCSSKGFCFAIRDDGGDDIYIRDHQLNHAWNGDRVLVRITREGGRRRSPEGGVQCILERSTTSLLGQVERRDDQLFAVPLDDRMLTTIRLPNEAEEHVSSENPTAVVEVLVDRYPIAQHPALGQVVRPLPLNGGPAADRDLLLTKAGLHQRPSPPRGSGKVPVAKGRIDFTEQPCFVVEKLD
jgi:ribonuclease R